MNGRLDLEEVLNNVSDVICGRAVSFLIPSIVASLLTIDRLQHYGRHDC